MKWIQDSDGDIGLSFWDIIVFWKYKHSVLVEWFPQDTKLAAKYVKQETV